MRNIYGINPVTEALRSGGSSVSSILISRKKSSGTDEIKRMAKEKNIAVENKEPSRLTEIAGTSKHQGVVALLSGDFAYVDIEDIISASEGKKEPPLLLILDSIKDPQNLGAIIRSALAAGASGVVIPKDRACQITATVVKASAGATEHIPIALVTNLAATIGKIKEANIWVAAISADGSESLFETDLTGPMALVVGSEGEGIRRLVKKHCDMTVSIPITGEVNSLNASNAAAVALFETRRQRLKNS